MSSSAGYDRRAVLPGRARCDATDAGTVTCKLTLTITRTRHEEQGGTTLDAVQSRRIELTLTP